MPRSQFSPRQTAVLLAILLLVCTLALIASCTPNQEAPPAPLPYADQLQQALEQALRAGQDEADLGISAAVLVPGYEPWIGVAGNSQSGVPLAGDMLFNMGSIAKSFEAALALQLAEEGVLNLDGPLSAWLPTLPRVDGRITIRQLLDHSSGLFNVFEHPDFPWVGPDVDYGRRWQMAEVFDRFVSDPYGPPGYVQHYASTNYLLLTAILEEAAGTSVPEQVQHRYFDILQLDASYMSMGDLPPGDHTLAHPWVDIDGDGRLEDLHGVPQTWIASLTHPVLYATPLDMARWMAALYHEKRILSAASLQQMLAVPTVTELDPEGARYGLGVVDYAPILGIPAIGHGGSSLGYSAAALYLPDRGVTLAWAVNTGESPQVLADDLMWATWSHLSEVILAHETATGQDNP